MLLHGKKPNAQPTFEREDAMNPSDKFVTASAKKWDSWLVNVTHDNRPLN